MLMDCQKRILVTGAGGLIGGCAIKALYNAGHNVTGLYRKEPSGRKDYCWNVLEADLTKSESEVAIEAINADCVVHCAAVLPEKFEGDKAIQVAKTNKKIDDQIIKYCRTRGASLMYTSSASIYGFLNSVCNEDSPVHPEVPYAAAKYETEHKIVRLIDNYIILRINAPYGKKQRSKTVLKLFIERALTGLDLLYHGSGKRQQDFIAVEDVAKAITYAVSSKSKGEIINIASGNSISMKNLAELVIHTIPGTMSRVLASGQIDPQEDYRAIFDISKSNRVLSWAPSVSLKDGIRRWASYIVSEK